MGHAAYSKRPDPNGPRPFATPFDQINPERKLTIWSFVGVEDNNEEMPDYLEPPYSLQDIAMQQLSYLIRSTKQDWQTKFRNPDIRVKWKEEIIKQEQDANKGDSALTPEMIDYVLDELEMHERDEQQPQGIRHSCFDKVYESDRLIPQESLRSLKTCVAKLEEVSDEQKDWHPGSNNQVLDLVHPSLFPLMYGKTPIFKRDEFGNATKEMTTAPAPRNAMHSTSTKFQWLPTDFEIAADGSVTIKSYINNLHPEKHKATYGVLAGIFECFVPMFERLLSDCQAPPPRRIPVTADHAYGWYKEEYDFDAHDGDDDDYEEFLETREIVLPAPEKPFEMPAPVTDDTLAFKIRGRTVQVIVKLANIHLTPDKPEYPGGSWHVEGMQNEEIVASGIYYYDEDNISESRLAFRGTFDQEDLPYEQCDNRGVRTVFGIEDEGPILQDYGSLITKGGRAIAFPNIYQHCVSPFELQDKSKPGHRKILVFFLVDPLKRIPSTSDVPPQQLEWVSSELDKPRIKADTLPSLPAELWSQALKATDMMSLDEAKKVREELMRERQALVKQNDQIIFQRPFSLCEH
ncbi:hypothetical protein OIV83_005944 [Microbotryomycetes sp. JL201]|nr:hypothetical protein OIV83_005944 [Microbotryomycetes sp. JL201]